MNIDEIGIDSQDLASLFTLNGLFNLLGKDLNEIVNFLRFIGGEQAKRFIEVYDSLSASEKKKLDLDKLADKAGYSKQSVRSLIISALIEQEIDCTKLLLIVCKKEIVMKTIQSALGDGEDSFKDREMLMEYYGYRVVKSGEKHPDN